MKTWHWKQFDWQLPSYMENVKTLSTLSCNFKERDKQIKRLNAKIQGRKITDDLLDMPYWKWSNCMVSGIKETERDWRIAKQTLCWITFKYLSDFSYVRFFYTRGLFLLHLQEINSTYRTLHTLYLPVSKGKTNCSFNLTVSLQYLLYKYIHLPLISEKKNTMFLKLNVSI